MARRALGFEMKILAKIVDAMIAVQSDLQDASVEEWTETLLDSCRRWK